MHEYEFHDEYSLAEVADRLGKKAVQLGLIRSFVVRYFPDCRQYYIPNEIDSPALTPEEAYLRLKKIVEQAEE